MVVASEQWYKCLVPVASGGGGGGVCGYVPALSSQIEFMLYILNYNYYPLETYHVWA